jgi:hypothetical protein
MPLSVLRRVYSSEKIATLYGIFDELCCEASAVRPKPFTETEENRFRERLVRAIIMTVSSGEHDMDRIKVIVYPLVTAQASKQDY